MSSLLYAIDCFKKPFGLVLATKPMLSTLFGQMVSIVILVLVLIAIANSGLVRKTNPNVIEKTTTLGTGPSLTYGDLNTKISFAIVDKNKTYYQNASYFKIEANLYNTKGNQILQTLSTVPCGNFVCLAQGTFPLQGSYDAENAEMVGLSLRICNSRTDNIACQTPVDISTYFLGKFLTVNFPNYQYDAENYDNPLQIINSSITYPVNVVANTVIYVNIMQSSFLTDTGLITSSEETVGFYELDTVSTTSASALVDSSNTFFSPIMQVNFVSSKKSLAVSRRYQKLLELLAALTGVATSIYVVGVYLSDLQVYLTYFASIVNELYIYPKKQKPKNEKDDVKMTDIKEVQALVNIYI